MNRRSFLQTCAAAGIGSALPWCTTASAATVPRDFFPVLPPVKRLLGVPFGDNLSWEEKNLYTCLQGLVNSRDPHLYFVGDDYDQLWFDYYGEAYAIPSDTMDDPSGLLVQYADMLDGHLVYDENMLDSLNVATSLGAAKNALPVAPSLVERVEAAGLKPLNDLRGRWKDRYQAYEWAIHHLHAHCHPRILTAICVDRPEWPSASTWVRDYAMAHRLFVCDLSASRRDRRDRALLTQIFARMNAPGWALGWRCGRCTEHEYVALAAQHGISMQCGLSTLNLSIHAAMPRPEKAFEQEHATVESVGPIENKVYVSFMNTDGDATFSMTRLHSSRLRDPEHGRIPYSWGFLPVAVDLLPGVARYLYENKLPSDYFVASTCGAMYTYPLMHPDMEQYMAATRDYMNCAGLRAAYISNWDDDYWWQEINDPTFVSTLRRTLPEAVGFVRGMGESAFEPHYLTGGAPYVFCGEGIHSKGDIYETLKAYVDALPQRPLFLFCLVNHSRSQGEIVQAVERLGNDDFRWITLDDFLCRVSRAREQNLIGDDLDPATPDLWQLLVEEGRAMWPDVAETIAKHAERARAPETAFLDAVEDDMTRLILERSATPPADIVAFDAVYDSMRLVKSWLNSESVYVNNKARGVSDFMDRFGDCAHAPIVEVIWRNWMTWDTTPVSYDEACTWARELGELAKEKA